MRGVLRWAVLACAVAFIVIGVVGQEHLEVLDKAVRVCLQCIGIA